MKARLMIALVMIGACSLNVTAMPKSGDTIRTESQISPLEMLLPLELSYLNGVLVDNPWNANWFVRMNGTAWTTTILYTRLRSLTDMKPVTTQTVNSLGQKVRFRACSRPPKQAEARMQAM